MLDLKFTLYVVLLIGIPIGLSLLILWFIKKRNYPSKYRLIALLPMLYLAYGLYQGLARPYSLYESHFEEITGHTLPTSTEFLDYVDWGYGTYPSDNSSLFHIKVDAEFYEKLKVELSPSTKKLEGLNQEVRHRFETMFGDDFADKVDFQFSKYNGQGTLLCIVGFFEEDYSLLVHAWKD